MDAKKLKVGATGRIHVKDAEGVPLYEGDKPVVIVVHAPGTKAFGELETRQSARNIKRLNENDGKLTALTSEERTSETADDLAAVTVAFENLTYGEEKGPEMFRALYADPTLGFITRQVSKHLADWGNFKAGSNAA